MNATANIVPSARLVIIPKAAHAVNFNSPEVVTSEVLQFVANQNAQDGKSLLQAWITVTILKAIS